MIFLLSWTSCTFLLFAVQFLGGKWFYIEKQEKEQFIKDLRRSSSMPIINVQLMEGRPPEKVAAVIRNITNTVSETLNAPKESIRVIVTEVPKTHWGIAGTPASER